MRLLVRSGNFYQLLPLLFFSFTVYFTNAQANSSRPAADPGNTKVSITGNNIPLRDVFKAIRQQTGLSIMYNKDASGVDGDERVSLHFKQERLDKVLTFLFQERNIEWIYNDLAILLRKKAASKKNVLDSSITRIATLTGKVTDATGMPVPGATVLVKGTRHGINTDEEGNFTLSDVQRNTVLLISSVGYESREVLVKGKSILAQLNVDVSELDEAVVIAYGTSTKRSNVGAVTVVQGKEVENLPNRSVDRSLQGLVPGLLVTAGNGQPGGGISNFVIRGIGTGTDATRGSIVRNPLIVIDGVPVTQEHLDRAIIGSGTTPNSNPMAQINPADIETISVLKDAAAIALYGTRAANGVILITTKRGKSGKTQFSFRHQTDFQKRLDGKIKLLDQQEYLNLLYESYKNQDPTYWTDARIKTDLISKFPTIVKSPGDTLFYPQADWLNGISERTAITISNDLSLSGGNERGNFYLNFSYVNQDGIVKNTGFDRASVRYNMENSPTSWITIGLNSMLSYSKQNYASQSIADAYRLSPLNPIKLQDGSYYFVIRSGTPFNSTTAPNPIAAQEYNINQSNSYRQVGSVFAELSFLKNFKFRTLVGVDFMLAQVKNKVDPRLPSGELEYPGENVGSVAEQDTRKTTLITTNTLRYDRNFRNGHDLSLLVGQESQEAINKTIGASSQGLAVPSFEEVSNGTSNINGYGFRLKESLLSFFGQANYSYSNKYLLSVSIRRDGSSKFGINERYGNYWSVGVGWVLSDEAFLKNTSSWLNYLKLRSSLGTSGNAAAINSVSRFYQLSTINYAGNPGVQPYPNPGNEDIKWEKTFNIDIGLETTILQERVKLTADVYKRNTTDLIYAVTPPPVSGFSSSYFDNIGEIENKGIEVSLSADIVRTKNFRWNLNVLWSSNKNKLIKANENFPKYLLGQEWSSLHYVRWAGVNPQDGKPQWLDSTGKITSSYNALDFVNVGQSQPDGFGSINTLFNYKNIELSVAFYYQYGYKVYDGAIATFANDGAGSPYINQSTFALNRWQKPGDNAPNPRRVLNNPDNSTAPSTRYVYDGDHIRLQNISISYTFPQHIVSRMKLNGCRVYLQGYNLALWNKYSGSDPQNVGVTGSAELVYPQAKSYSIGLNVNF